jgi:hypothetical protein
MRKNLLFMLTGLILFFSSGAQQLSPNVIASDGGISKAAGISLEWTLGETTVESLTTSNKLYTQGFHQPMLIAKQFHTTVDTRLKDFDISVMPNPVQSVLTVTLAASSNEKVYLSLVDMTGRRTFMQVANAKGTSLVDMSGMISGIYILEVRSVSNQLIKSFKVIKAE